MVQPDSSRPTIKPYSLPKNWPHSSADDISQRPERIIHIGDEQHYIFNSNFVKTSKYEFYNFLPKFLFEEFRPTTKFANCYFLFIAALQTIPEITNTAGYPTVLLPLIFVVLVDAIFAAMEDMARHRADREANSSIVHRLNRHSRAVENIKWADLVVGDFVLISSREKIPADIVVVAVAEKSDPPMGICYVETKSLDGETNLKIRNALPSTHALVKDIAGVASFTGKIHMEHPNKHIDSFSGVIELTGIGKDPIMSNNVILRGCVLRNTDWIVGLVVNTGHDTKIMMSNTETPSKTSNLESSASSEIKRMVGLLCFVCLIGAIGSVIWSRRNDVFDIWYLDWKRHLGAYFVIQFFYFFLLHATFIPVSLYVTMTLVRFFQSYFMNIDLEMYYAKTDTPALVRTMTLNEELGQISHIFSDKTGTLTCNIMDFRKASINGVSYGKGITEIGKASWKLQGKVVPEEILRFEEQAKANAVPHVSFYCPDYVEDMKRGGTQKKMIHEFFRVLALCHDVIAERVDGKIKLSASNPDDEALVYAAEYFGIKFCDRKEGNAILLNKETNQNEEIKVLESIAFTSDRKRMSVIIRDSNGKVRLLSKGADTAMMERLHAGQDEIIEATDRHMRQYAVEGLRCLVVCCRDIEEGYFRTWRRQYNEATTNLVELEKRKKGKPNKIAELESEIESHLQLIGCTAIEDRLQDGVPECIAQLAEAGINIWVLTGDKEETAINIAVACNLVLPKEYMRQVIINKSTAPTLSAMHSLLTEEITLYKQDMSFPSNMLPRALIIDGPSLIIAMADVSPNGVRSVLLDFSKLCKAVVGCRVSPDQKREMVSMIKVGVPGVRTLSVGDGANDVAMIQEAHVGVGIRGEEGVQAVNASDYAIAQFKYLSPLLLKHGRYNYIRMCGVVCYMFHKNIMMSICNFWYAWLNGFSGQKIYTEASIQFFNLFFTSLPIILYGVYDMDVPKMLIYQFPALYKIGRERELFNVFWLWMFNAVCDSLACTYMPVVFFMAFTSYSGVFETFHQAGALTYSAIIILANIKVAMLHNQLRSLNIIIMVLSAASWFAVAYGVSAFVAIDYEWYKLWNQLMRQSVFWLGLAMIVSIVLTKDFYLITLKNMFNPSDTLLVLEMAEKHSDPPAQTYRDTGAVNYSEIYEKKSVVDGIELGNGDKSRSSTARIGRKTISKEESMKVEEM